MGGVTEVYAVIQTGGKQYRVQQGDVIYVEKIAAEAGANVSFDVLMLNKDEAGTVIGTPVVEGAKVEGKVVGQVKSAKIIVYKYKAKKNERKKQGHRQPYTKVEITAING
jgi:large subunit ribosomal protein L21